MILTPFVGMSLYFYFAVLSPMLTLRSRCTEDDKLARWLVYFFCLNSVCIPLLLLPWIPMRYELMLAAAAFLAINDARVAQRLVESCVLARVGSGENFAHFLFDPVTPTVDAPVTQTVDALVGSSG